VLSNKCSRGVNVTNATTKTKGFFDERRDQSEVKSTLYCHYFNAWMNIVGSRANKVAYIVCRPREILRRNKIDSYSSG
jgi:hypothetical protein